jgi:hypothetical protein
MSGAVWVTQDGRELLPCDMADDHLVNTIRYVRRRVEAYRLKVAMTYGHGLVGEHAQEAAEKELDFLLDLEDEWFLESCFPVWTELKSEARRRGLEGKYESRASCLA